MIQQNAPISGGRRALSLILAVVFGILTPVAMTLEVMLILPVVMLSGLFMVFFHAYGGRMSAWLYMTVQLAATAVLLGSTFMWMTMVAGTFPGILCMRGILGKQSFFGQLRVDIAFYLFGLLGAVLIAFGAYGGNIIGRGMDYFEAQFKQIPDSWFQPFVEAINAQLQLSGSARLSVEGYRAQAQAVIQLMGETFARELPGTFINGALLSGVFSALWGNWLMARRGLASDSSYVQLNGWFLPKQTTFGLLTLWLGAYIIASMGYQSGESVYAAAYAIVSTAFAIQGIAGTDRFLFRRGWQSARRRGIIGALLVLGLVFRLFNTFLFILGMFSALFGSHGAITMRNS